MSPWDVPIALALIGASALVVIAVAIRKHRIRLSRERASTPRLPAPRRQCWTTGCGYPATAMVVRSKGFNAEVLDVCEGCADEGCAFGWWFRLQFEPF